MEINNAQEQREERVNGGSKKKRLLREIIQTTSEEGNKVSSVSLRKLASFLQKELH